uniref:Uncharacterized protein n=1 Tax=Glossina austeni TaxID=7395 RepID=A0A1A9VHM6_GLOAU
MLRSFIIFNLDAATATATAAAAAAIIVVTVLLAKYSPSSFFSAHLNIYNPPKPARWIVYASEWFNIDSRMQIIFLNFTHFNFLNDSKCLCGQMNHIFTLDLCNSIQTIFIKIHLVNAYYT